MEAELKKCAVIPNKIFRIEGYDDELNGMRGCVYSHIKALDFALNQGWRNVLVLEDDCLFIKNQEKIHSYIHHFLNHFKNDWDLFFLGTQIHSFQKTDHENYVRVIFSLRAHAYVVNGHYILKLRNHFVSTYESLKDDLFFVTGMHKALDRQWVELQMLDRWFAGINMIARQRKSFSDIEKTSKPKR